MKEITIKTQNKDKSGNLRHYLSIITLKANEKSSPFERYNMIKWIFLKRPNDMLFTRNSHYLGIQTVQTESIKYSMEKEPKRSGSGHPALREEIFKSKAIKETRKAILVAKKQAWKDDRHLIWKPENIRRLKGRIIAVQLSTPL